jgi:hypothetical protein
MVEQTGEPSITISGQISANGGGGGVGGASSRWVSRSSSAICCTA